MAFRLNKRAAMRQLSCSLMTVSGEIILIHVADDADVGFAVEMETSGFGRLSAFSMKRTRFRPFRFDFSGRDSKSSPGRKREDSSMCFSFLYHQSSVSISSWPPSPASSPSSAPRSSVARIRRFSFASSTCLKISSLTSRGSLTLTISR